MPETHSEKQIMTYSDTDIDAAASYLRGYGFVELDRIADMLAQYKIDRAFLRTRADTAEYAAKRWEDVAKKQASWETLWAEQVERADTAEAALRELTEPISDAGQTTADGLRHEIEQLRARNTDLMAKWGIATGRALAAESARDLLRRETEL